MPAHRFPRAEPHEAEDVWEGSQELGQGEWWGGEDVAGHNSTMGANKGSADGKLIGKDFSGKEVRFLQARFLQARR